MTSVISVWACFEKILFSNWTHADFLICKDFIPVDIVCEVKVVFSVSIRHQGSWGHMCCAENLKMILKNCELLQLPSLSVRVLKPNSWTYYFVKISQHNFESSQTWGFRIQCWHYKLDSNHFCSVEWNRIRQWRWLQGGKFFRLLSQLRPRIRPL